MIGNRAVWVITITIISRSGNAEYMGAVIYFVYSVLELKGRDK